MTSDNAEDPRLVMKKVVPAVPEKVWELWTTPEGIGQWWAPDGSVRMSRSSISYRAAC